MPRSQADADVLVYEGRRRDRSTLSGDGGATVTEFGEYQSFVDREHAEVDAAIDRILGSGADVVIASGNIESRARERLARADVTAFYEVDREDRRQVALATGATPVGDLDVLTTDHLWLRRQRRAGEIQRFDAQSRDAPAERTMMFDDLAGETVGTILLRGGTEHALDEVERAVEDSVGVTVAAVEDKGHRARCGRPGDSSRARRARARDRRAGREQLALEAFADSLETLPRTLAENASHDVVDALIALRTRHDDGDWARASTPTLARVVDAYEAGVMEPYRVKSCALSSAVDAATLVLRIDDLISAGDPDGEPRGELSPDSALFAGSSAPGSGVVVFQFDDVGRAENLVGERFEEPLVVDALARAGDADGGQRPVVAVGDRHRDTAQARESFLPVDGVALFAYLVEFLEERLAVGYRVVRRRGHAVLVEDGLDLLARAEREGWPCRARSSGGGHAGRRRCPTGRPGRPRPCRGRCPVPCFSTSRFTASPVSSASLSTAGRAVS